MNLSETVFVLPATVEDADVRIRIFTPEVELPFAGHPTLGSAFVLGGPLQKIVIRLETGSGVVPVELERDGPRIVFGWMEQPIPRWESESRMPRPILAALGVEGSGLPVERYDLGPGPRLRRARLAGRRSPGCGPTSPRSAARRPTASTCFARDGAALEDADVRARVTASSRIRRPGSAAGPLAIHLARHGRIAFGEQIEISQGAEINRPSTLFARCDGEGDRIDRVRVGGSAVVVARGEFSF